MACIHCGLRQRSDGKGTLDIDTVGGIECSGVGAESDNNTSGRGIRIKKNATVGNSAIVDGNGLYVPRASNFTTHYATYLGGPVSDPNYPVGAVYYSPTVSLSFPNVGGVNNDRAYMWSASVDWAVSNSSVTWWMELHTQVNGGGWVAGAGYVGGGNVATPIMSHLQPLTVAPGITAQIDARVMIYTGHVGLYRVSISGFGDYTGGVGVA